MAVSDCICTNGLSYPCMFTGAYDWCCFESTSNRIIEIYYVLVIIDNFFDIWNSWNIMLQKMKLHFHVLH